MDTTAVDLLKGVELFSELNEEQLGMIANLVIVKNYNRDETVVLEGDDSMQALYLIVKPIRFPCPLKTVQINAPTICEGYFHVVYEIHNRFLLWLMPTSYEH